MEIKRIGNTSNMPSEKKKVEGKKDFSQSFNFARDRKSKEQLENMIEDIKKKGDRLIVTKCYSDVKAYKKLIKEYLKNILNYMYGVKKDISFWQTQYFITVDNIDKSLEELTALLLSNEKDTMKIASTIDTISGLVLDIYK